MLVTPLPLRVLAPRWMLSACVLLVFVSLLPRVFAGQIDEGNRVLMADFTIPAGGPRKVLVRGAGPTDGAAPNLAVAVNYSTIVATQSQHGPADDASMNAAGVFQKPAGSQSASLVATLEPGVYTVILSDLALTRSKAVVEVYDVTSTTAPRTLHVSARGEVGFDSAQFDASFNVRAGLGTRRVLIRAVGPGLGTLGVGDFTPDPKLTIQNASASTVGSNDNWNSADSGSMSQAGAFPLHSGSGDAAVVLTLSPGDYVARVVDAASGRGALLVEMYDVTNDTPDFAGGSLFVANLRPPTGVNSRASGSASIQLSTDERFLSINLSFSGLTSSETAAYLRLSNAGEDGAYLVRLPIGETVSRVWQIQDTGGYSVADIVAALKAGKLYISVGSENFPSGELRGSFLTSGGPTDPNPPPPPPPPPTSLTAEDAARFLIQATFGPTRAEIDALVTKGFDTWLNEQMSLPASSHKDEAQADFAAFNTNTTVTRPQGSHRQSAWWKIAVTGQDQLRQRVAFALSQIFVISDVNGRVSNWQDGAANYYDLLARGAFGNFRTLLEDVTLSPMMGVYLSHIRNGKATSTTQPDENYAREIMQLFTIGLHQLNPDGTLKLDGNGLPIPTYDQRTISEMAKVFTGWQFNNANPTQNNFRSGGGTSEDYMKPMTLNPFFHDNGAKTIINGITLPANQGGAKDLADTLDALFNHPNTAPFICRQLIQRLVTSNPSSGYVSRVAQVFANNGSGVRGDLGAVVRAILLDPEARSAQTFEAADFGKLKEPLLRVTALLRAFRASAENGRYAITNPEGALGQAALRSPTVFNFFEPNFVLPGTLAAAGLYAPEYQILTATTAISVPNQLYSYTYNNRGPTTIGLDLTVLPPTSPASGLVDYLNLVFCAGSMPPAIRSRIETALNAMPTSATATDRYRAAIYLTVTTQEAAIQK